MKSDTQHLEFLISQYVDGSLDVSGKKSLEQRLLNDPEARGLYKEHHDVQDVLDDWGNRIPLINWEEFDQVLAQRLEHEMVGGPGRRFLRRWAKPLSIAAALVVAASLGYGWRGAMTNGHQPQRLAQAPQQPEAPSRRVAIESNTSPTVPSRIRFQVDEASDHPQVAANTVRIAAPGNVEAAESLKASVAVGLSTLNNVSRAALSTLGPASVHVAEATATPQPKKDDREEAPLPPTFP